MFIIFKIFTFISMEEIKRREQNKHLQNQIINDKSFLAKNITRLVQGKEQLLAVERITEFCFKKYYSN